MTRLYEELVEQFARSGISLEQSANGYFIPYSKETENYVAKVVQDFYHLVGYNILLLNQNGNCRICLEKNQKDSISLLQDLKVSLDGYMEQVDYVSLMNRDVKATFNLFKKSLNYSGNFGIGVKNFAGV